MRPFHGNHKTKSTNLRRAEIPRTRASLFCQPGQTDNMHQQPFFSQGKDSKFTFLQPTGQITIPHFLLQTRTTTLTSSLYRDLSLPFV